MLSLVKRRPKTIAALLSVIAIIFLYVTFCGVTVARVRDFRRHPQRSRAVTFFGGNWPHQILARLLVFKSGGRAYNADLLEWAYHSRLIEDGILNRWILETNITNIPEQEQIQLLPHYPLTPTERLLPIISRAMQENHYEVLPLLGRSTSPQAKPIYKQWVDDKLVRARNPKLFVAASGSLAQSNIVFLPDLLNIFWPQLKPAEKQRVTAKIAAHLDGQTGIETALFEWAKTTLLADSSKFNNGSVALLGKFLSLNSTRQPTTDFIARQGTRIEPQRAELLFRYLSKEELATVGKPVLESFKEQNVPTLLELLHYAAHEDIPAAETLAEPFLSGSDSELRKGVIVMLARHGSLRGKGIIEESFSGMAPRKTMFVFSSVYGNGNRAAQLYRELSTHDYVEVGKTWPPVYFGKRPSAAEISGWKQFIATYPWFPGTDDAYYRLAFSQLAQKDFQGCLTTINQYLKRDYWPDNDVRPHMLRVLRNLILQSYVADQDFPFAQQLRTIAQNPLAPMLLGPRDQLDAVIDSLNWFLTQPNSVQFLNTTMSRLQLMRDVALTIRDAPPDSVCRMVAAKLEIAGTMQSSSELDDTDIDYPDEKDVVEDIVEDREADYIVYFRAAPATELPISYSSSAVQSTLYGLFDAFPSPDATVAVVPLPPDPGEQAIRQMASLLKANLANGGMLAIQQHLLDEQIVLALLHTDFDFEKWQADFQPIREQLLAVNPRDVPSISAKRHQRLLAQGTR